MLVLSSQSRLFGTNPIMWLCNQEQVKTLKKGSPPEKAKLKQWWTYLSHFKLSVHHIQRKKSHFDVSCGGLDPSQAPPYSLRSNED